MVIVPVGCWLGWRGAAVLRARLSFQLDILRLMTRGLLRGPACEQVALDLSQGLGQRAGQP